jgi:hypothetical protein
MSRFARIVKAVFLLPFTSRNDGVSEEPKRSNGKRWGCAVLVLIGAVIGYFCGVYYFCPPGAGNDCGVLGFFVGVPLGIAVGLVAYAVVRLISLLR